MKFLAICLLAKQKIFLYGTSVGAFKLAAAAQCDSALAFKRLADGYIAQDYSKDFSTAAIARETQRIIDKVLPDEAVTQVLNSEKYLFGCGAVQCTGLLGSESLMQQRLGMVRATVQNALPWMGRPEFTRVICAGEAARPLIKLDAGRFISLQEDTFKYQLTNYWRFIDKKILFSFFILFFLGLFFSHNLFDKSLQIMEVIKMFFLYF